MRRDQRWPHSRQTSQTAPTAASASHAPREPLMTRPAAASATASQAGAPRRVRFILGAVIARSGVCDEAISCVAKRLLRSVRQGPCRTPLAMTSGSRDLDRQPGGDEPAGDVRVQAVAGQGRLPRGEPAHRRVQPRQLAGPVGPVGGQQEVEGDDRRQEQRQQAERLDRAAPHGHPLGRAGQGVVEREPADDDPELVPRGRPIVGQPDAGARSEQEERQRRVEGRAPPAAA